MTLAAVMNGKGNGNKDEVVQRIKHTLYVILYYQFLYISLGTISTGGKDPAGRPMGSIIASTRGNIKKLGRGKYIAVPRFSVGWILMRYSIVRQIVECLLSGIKYFGGGPVVSVPFAWYHICFTINYLPSKEAERSAKFLNVMIRVETPGKSTSMANWTLRSPPNTYQRYVTTPTEKCILCRIAIDVI